MVRWADLAARQAALRAGGQGCGPGRLQPQPEEEAEEGYPHHHLPPVLVQVRLQAWAGPGEISPLGLEVSWHLREEVGWLFPSEERLALAALERPLISLQLTWAEPSWG